MLQAFLIPILYAGANLADKILVEGDDDDSSPRALLALSGMFAGMFAVIFGLYIFFTGRSFGDMVSIIMLITIGALYYAAILIYLDMLKIDDASNVTAWFEVIPVFGVVGALVILNEVPQLYQIVAIIMLVIGGFTLSIKDGEFNKTIVFWMIISAALLALYDVLFATYGRGIDEFSAIFFMLVGKTACGFVVMLFDRQTRRGFWIGLTTKLKGQFISESINTMADIAMYVCILFMPILFVQGVATLQPLCVLVGAIIFGRVFSQLKEDNESVNLRKKVIAFVLMIGGAILLV